MHDKSKKKPHRFYGKHNQATRIDLFQELSHTVLGALSSFCRRLGAPQLLDELIIPTLEEGDTQIFAAVRDRPWPPWGVGARHVSALCLVQAVADESYALSPVYVTDEDATNVGLMSALYKEVLENLVVSSAAEVNYLAAEGSTLIHHLLEANGFRRHEDVLLTEDTRYYTYRASAEKLLSRLGLDCISTPDLLAEDIPAPVLERNAIFHESIFMASRAALFADVRSEIIHLPRGSHAGKPGGVPGGTGRWGYPAVSDPPDWFFVSMANFLGDARQKLMDYALKNEPEFRHSTVVDRCDDKPVVDERLRRSRTLDELGPFGAVFEEKIKEVLAEVIARLRHPGFPVGRIEMQVTASSDGDYFRMHRDSDDESTRELSFVYYFYREPRRFSGGELRIFDNEWDNGKPVPTDRSQTLSPRQDTIIFFQSRSEHEVLPVRVPTGTFGDSRFTVNGWIHRGK
ncbi:2OG-Fe(II) oxygenase [Haliangium sp.]|uniref:2OG-Fe(II) oxygenase n=1 Tax=Haliangium sp. TaxID=2663208 RepID=UPI003D12D138